MSHERRSVSNAELLTTHHSPLTSSTELAMKKRFLSAMALVLGVAYGLGRPGHDDRPRRAGRAQHHGQKRAGRREDQHGRGAADVATA